MNVDYNLDVPYIYITIWFQLIRIYTMDYNLNLDHILDLESTFRIRELQSGLQSGCTIIFHNMDSEPKL